MECETTYERKEISDGNIELYKKVIDNRIEDLKSFSSYSSSSGMNKRSIELKKTFDYWVMGIHGIVPEDFKKILKSSR